MELYLYRVRLRALGSLRFMKFPGIPLEGAVTAGIRDVACACRSEEAEKTCPVRRRCAFHLLARPRAELFEALPKRFQTPPPPLVLRPRFPAGTHAAGATLELEAVLVGSAQESFRWMLAGLVAAGRRGVGSARESRPKDGCFEVRTVEVVGPSGARSVWDDQQPASAPHPAWRFPEHFNRPPSGADDVFTVEFRTPTLIVTGGARRGALEFPSLVGAISKRVSLLSMAYGDRHLMDREEHVRLQELAARVHLDAQACVRQEWSRHSSRQGRSFPVGGWTGWVRYRGDVTPFVPLLRLAALLHVGADTIRGFGEISLRDGP